MSLFPQYAVSTPRFVMDLTCSYSIIVNQAAKSVSINCLELSSLKITHTFCRSQFAMTLSIIRVSRIVAVSVPSILITCTVILISGI